MTRERPHERLRSSDRRAVEGADAKRLGQRQFLRHSDGPDDDNDRTIFWRVAAFNQTAQTELLRLRVGDAVSVQGAMQAEAYNDAAGDPRLSMRIIADQVLALRQKPMKQAEPPARPLTKEERDRLFPEWP